MKYVIYIEGGPSSLEIKIINEQSIYILKEEISESNYRDVESVTKHIHAKE